jgi:hypothetical protein
VGRRDVIAFVDGVALWPLRGAAQSAKVPTISVLAVESPGWEQFCQLFREGLRELSYVERQGI